MLKIIHELKMGKDLYEYDIQKTNELNFAIYFSDIHQYIYEKVPLHWHKEFELTLVIKGEIQLYADHHQIILHQGEGCFINSHIIHGYDKTNNSGQFISILFDSQFITGNDEDILFHKYIQPILENKHLTFILLKETSWQKEILDYIQKSYDTIQKQNTGFEFEIRHYLSKIIINILTHKEEYHEPFYTHDKALSQMLRFIENHYHQKLCVDDIAEAGHVSRRECYRKFQDTLFITPNHYLEIIRLNKAIELLNETDKTITEICYETGYLNASYFTTKFKNHLGTPPSQYRKKIKKL